jgi:hypothetical protein
MRDAEEDAHDYQTQSPRRPAPAPQVRHPIHQIAAIDELLAEGRERPHYQQKKGEQDEVTLDLRELAQVYGLARQPHD